MYTYIILHSLDKEYGLDLTYISLISVPGGLLSINKLLR